jgi:inner membrane protein
MTPGGYVEGFRSLAADRGAMRFVGHPSNVQALREAGEVPTVQRLVWFTHGFVQARVVQDNLVLSDLRMGSEPDYFFRFAVAKRAGPAWQPMPVREVAAPPRDMSAMWQSTWTRIWNEPVEP